MATGQKSKNPLLGLMPAPQGGLAEAGINALQSLGILRPKTSNISYMTADANKPSILGSNEAKKLKQSYEQVQKQKTQYATKELPKRVNKAAQQVDKFYKDLANNPDYADRAQEIKQVSEQVKKQINQQALMKQQTALTDTDPEKVNQFGVKKAQTEIKKATGQQLSKEDKYTEFYGDTGNRLVEGAVSKLAQMGKDASTVTNAIGAKVSQSVENLPGVKQAREAQLGAINSCLNQNVSADERINLLKQKSFLESNSQVQAQNVKQQAKAPNALESLQNQRLGERIAQDLRKTGAYKTGEFIGEAAPLAIMPETGLGEVAVNAIAKTGVGKALAKYGGSNIAKTFVKGAVENAIQEQPLGLIQEGAKVAAGEQTLGQAAQAQLGRTALAAGLGGGAEAGLSALGKVADATILAPARRAEKFKDIQAQRATVQADRIARDADIEEVQNALLGLKQKQAAEQFAPNYVDKIAERTQKRTAKEVNSVIKDAEKTVKQTAKEEQAVQSALEKLEKQGVKAEDLQYKQEAALGKQTAKGVNEAVNDVQAKFAREELQTRKAEILARKEQINSLKTEIKDVQAGLSRNLPDAKYSQANLEDLTNKLGSLQKAESERLALSQAERINLQADQLPRQGNSVLPERQQFSDSSQSVASIEPQPNLRQRPSLSNVSQDIPLSARLDNLDSPVLTKQDPGIQQTRTELNPGPPATDEAFPRIDSLNQKVSDTDNLPQIAQSTDLPKSLDNDLIRRPAATGDIKTNKLFETIDKNPNISTELKARLKERGNTTYQTRNTKELFDRAASRVEVENVDELAKEIRLKSRNEGKWTDEEVATGYELARKFEAEGRLDEAAEIEEALAKKATEGGQMIQAYAKYGKTTPEGALREANKIIEKSMPAAKAKQLKEATSKLIKDFNQANKKAIEDILNFCPQGSF